ncbi:ABC transporter ATP-binding protein [candidate division KSB1 bacterium]|nr:ABC transporter ATP-binding protein [candidate division KSB1 bacterium]RQW05665.1 MAG: ABC transporter ATP-binding protein [candidate division KSB1 bacterium]
MISVVNLTKSFDKRLAVDHVDLEVANELFIFLGPNGAGKTTTIKMITGLLRPDEGEVVLGGIHLLQKPVEAKRQFGYAPEQPNLYEKLTATEFIDFIMSVYNTPYESGRVRMQQLFEIFEIADRANDLIEDLSHGMKKKVSLIAALIHQPKILFLDEPTVALDPKAARNLKDILFGLIKKNVTVFMTTHILQVAETMCDRIGIINKGKLCAIGSLAELRQQHGEHLSLEDLFLKLTGEPYTSKIDEFLRTS